MVSVDCFGHVQLHAAFQFPFETGLDGEIISHLYARGGAVYAASMLDGVFAFCLVDTKKAQVHLARDTYGVRPLFISLRNGSLAVSSEAKGFIDLSHGFDLDWFLPGHVQSFNLLPSGNVSPLERIQFHSIEMTPKWIEIDRKLGAKVEESDLHETRRLFTEAVEKRLMSTRRIGCMLSGGLDSSLVSALVMKLLRENGVKYPLQTFSIGMEGSPDLPAARKVATHIGSEHHEVSFTAEEGIAAVSDVIYALESYDVITIRSAIVMYLLSKYIREKTDTTVVFSGEGSDELTQGYLYFHKQPTSAAGDEESRRLLKDLYAYDVLRADRMTAAHGLELRVPFLDHMFTSHYLSLPSDLRKPTNGVEKYFFRKAFDGTGLLPDDILWRVKEGFSDGVSSAEKSWYIYLKEHCEDQVPDDMMKDAPSRFPLNPPVTKEGYYYRLVFESFFPGRAEWMPYSWMPKWTDATDPSGRVYGS